MGRQRSLYSGKHATSGVMADPDRRRQQVFDLPAAGQAVFDLASHRLMCVNAKFCEITGYSEAELLAMPYPEFTHPDDLSADRERFARAVIDGISEYVTEMRYVCRDGGIRWVRVNAAIVRDSAGHPQSIACAIVDQTEQEQLGSQLAASQQFEQLLSDLSGGFSNIPSERVDAQISAALRKLLDFFGVDRCCLIKLDSIKAKAQIVHAAYGSGVRSIPEREDIRALIPWTCRQLASEERAVKFAYPEQLPAEAALDRETYRGWGMRSVLLVPVLVAGPVHYVFAMATAHEAHDWPDEYLMRLRVLGATLADTRVRKDTADALQRSEQRLAEAQRIAQLGSLDWDLEGGRMVWSDGLYQLLGQHSDSASFNSVDGPTRDDLLATVHPRSRKQVARALSAVRQDGKPLDMEYAIVRPDGSERVVHMRSEGFRGGAGGLPTRVTATFQDVTASKAAQQHLRELRTQLWHADRVARMGTMTASLAHELNQPLTAILSNAQAGLRFVERNEPDLSEIKEILTDIVQDDKRAGAVIQGLRRMVRRQQTDRGPVDLAEAVADIIRLLHSELVARDIQLAWKPEGTWTVLADRAQIQQVLLNLIMNALDAMEHVPGNRRRLELLVAGSGKNRVRLAVRDGGPGIPEDQLTRIFDPFWSTKGKGMGIGLAVCRSIVEAHGGRLRAENNDDGGATLLVELPRCEPFGGEN